MSSWGAGNDLWRQQQEEAARQAAAQQPPPQSKYFADPTGTGPLQGDPNAPDYGQPIVTHYNPANFATDATTNDLANQFGGRAVTAPMAGFNPQSPFVPGNPNYLSFENGSVANAGQLQTYIDAFGPVLGAQMAQQEIAGDTPQGLANQGSWSQLQDWQSSLPKYNTLAPPTQPTAATPPPAATGGTTGGNRGPIAGTSAANSYRGLGEVGKQAPGAGYRAAPGQNPVSDDPGASHAPATTAQPIGRTLPGGNPYRAQPGQNPASGGGATPPAVTQPPSVTPPPVGGTPRPPATGQPGLPGISGATAPAGPSTFPTWRAGDGTGNQAYNGGDPGFMASALQNRAIDYGNTFENDYGNAYKDAETSSRQYQDTADQAYNWLNDNPGYNAGEQADIKQSDLLNGGMTTGDEYAGNYLTDAEQKGIYSNPNAVKEAFDPSRITGAATSGIDWTKDQFTGARDTARAAGSTGAANSTTALNDYGSRLRGTIDPSKLGISDAQVDEMKNNAGRQIGLQYGAAQDQLQRQAEASGQVNPLALSAARDRLLRSSAIGQADAVTSADLAARDAQRQAQLGITDRQMSAENNLGTAGLSNAQANADRAVGTETYFGGLGANVGSTAANQNIAATQAAGNTAIQQAQAADAAASARNATIATNRQNTGTANQNTRFGQGYNASTAASGRAQGISDARIAGQQAARNYWQGQGQFQGTQANNASSSRIAGANTSLAGQGAGTTAAVNTEAERRNPSVPIRIAFGGL